jgi:hypothetical protein
MTIHIDLDEWIYIVVEKNENVDQIVGQHDTQHDVKFIPAYKDRSAAQKVAIQMALEEYEVQAIIYEDLLRYADQHKSMIFLLDSHGQLILKIAPDGGIVQ